MPSAMENHEDPRVGNRTDDGTGRDGMPRWVKVFIAIGVVGGFLLAGVALLGGPEHGPRRHLSPSSGGAGAGDVGGPAEADQGTRTVAVTALDTNSYEPASVAVERGETVTFVVTNGGDVAHEFVLGDAPMQEQRAQMRAHMGDQVPHDMPNALHLEPGETKELTWRFGDAGIEYACHEPGHYEGGMRGQITVA